MYVSHIYLYGISLPTLFSSIDIVALTHLLIIVMLALCLIDTHFSQSSLDYSYLKEALIKLQMQIENEDVVEERKAKERINASLIKHAPRGNGAGLGVSKGLWLTLLCRGLCIIYSWISMVE